jgi:Fe-S oxidoreductase
VLDAVKDALDLCVCCKGCMRDCPTGVDMAKMKVEFLHHYKARHGYTPKDKLVAHLPDYAHWAALCAAPYQAAEILRGQTQHPARAI